MKSVATLTLCGLIGLSAFHASDVSAQVSEPLDDMNVPSNGTVPEWGNETYVPPTEVQEWGNETYVPPTDFPQTNGTVEEPSRDFFDDGRSPIRVSYTVLQGPPGTADDLLVQALLLSTSDAMEDPFYVNNPGFAMIPVVEQGSANDTTTTFQLLQQNLQGLFGVPVFAPGLPMEIEYPGEEFDYPGWSNDTTSNETTSNTAEGRPTYSAGVPLGGSFGEYDE